MKTVISYALAVTAAVSAMPAAAQVFQGADANPAGNTTIPNSNAAAASFAAAAGALTTIDFESDRVNSTVPKSYGVLTITGPDFNNGPTVLDTSVCSFALCGGNTTTGGSHFLSIFGGSATLAFSTPASAFGFYLSGIQLPGSITYTDGAGVHTISYTGSADTDYFGVVSSGITSATINVGNDILSLDDVSFALAAAVPEPATWGMMLLGLGMVGGAMRRRPKSVATRVRFA